MLTKLLLTTLLLLGSLSTYAGNVAVVIIDMQYGFYSDNNTTNTAGLKALVAKQLELINWAKSKKAPVLVFEFMGKGKTDQRILNALTGHTHRVVQKTTDDGFSGYNGNLEDTLATLERWKIKNLIVAGINGGSCVHDSIQGAGVHGFVSHTTGEIVGDLTQNPPIYPDSEWFYSHPKLKTYKTLKDLLKKF